MCMVKTKNRGGIDHSADFAHQSFTDGILDLEFSLCGRRRVDRHGNGGWHADGTSMMTRPREIFYALPEMEE